MPERLLRQLSECWFGFSCSSPWVRASGGLSRTPGRAVKHLARRFVRSLKTRLRASACGSRNLGQLRRGQVERFEMEASTGAAYSPRQCSAHWQHSSSSLRPSSRTTARRRTAAAELERTGYEFVEKDGANARSYLAAVRETLFRRHMAIVGGSEQPKAPREAGKPASQSK
jgi:hypothetical protein